MALNWTMIGADRTPVPLPNEQTIRTINAGVELSLTIPNAPPTASSSAGGSGGARKLKESGRLWLTDQRLIFVVPNLKGALESLSVPLSSILSTAFEQPMFGANYLTFEIRPSPEGGLVDGTKAEIRFKDQGIFEFVGALEKTRERAIYMKRQKAEEDEEDGLPVYTSPMVTGAGTSQAGGSAPTDGPPGYDV